MNKIASSTTPAKSVMMNVDRGEKTWLTPLWLVRALGDFDLDPCVPDGGMPWMTASRMVTKSEDVLKVCWSNQRVWLNPPYGRDAVPFFEKMVGDRAHGIALVFARTDTSLWQDIIFPKADAVCFLRGRLRFRRQDATAGDTATAPSALVAFGREEAAVLAKCIADGDIKGSLLQLADVAKTRDNLYTSMFSINHK